MRYSKIIEKRGNLPRREVLENRRRRVSAEITSLVAVFKLEMTELEAELSVIDRSMMAHTYSTRTLSFLRDIEESIPEVSGVYVIEVRDSPVYVGESANVQRRCLDHAEAIVVPQEKAALMYRELGLLDPDQISFQLLDELDNDKKTRLARERYWAQHYTDLGFQLYNAAWRGRGTVPADDEVGWLRGLSQVVAPHLLEEVLRELRCP